VNFARAVLRRSRAAARAGAAALLTTLAGCGFGGSPSLPTVDVPTSVAIADVNGDGVPDLLVATTADQGNASNPGFASVILGNSSAPGTFHSGVHYGTTGGDPSSIATADLTGSGGIDLVVANFASGSVSVFMQRTRGASRQRSMSRPAAPRTRS
jgi:predicted small lipoprotein YifL